VTAFIPPHVVPNSPDGAMGEGIAIDAAGNIYTAKAQLRGVTKYVRKYNRPLPRFRRAPNVRLPQDRRTFRRNNASIHFLMEVT
jgi:hypothetical protein